MELVGKNLKKIRLDKKIDLIKVSKDLNITKDTLKKIENDEPNQYLDNVFILGHLRTYAKYLNLDENIIIQNFKSQNSIGLKKSQIEISKPIKSLNGDIVGN